MIKLIVSALLLGFGAGHFFLTPNHKDLLDTILLQALNLTVFIGGVEIGNNKELVKKMLKPKTLKLLLAVPTAVVLGTLIGGVAFGMLQGISFKDSLLISGGMGWYSFSSVAISTMYSAKIGTMSFLANMLREVASFFLIPLLAKFTDLPCVAIGGASTMDSTLPVILDCTNTKIGVFAFINGLVLSIVVPFLIMALLRLP